MKKVVSILLCACVVLFSCKKDNKNQVDKTYNADRFVEENGVKVTTYPFKVADLPKKFTLPGGTKVQIPANVAFTKDKIAVTGDFTLEAREFFSPSDIVLSGLNTNYKGGQFPQGTYLVSDGFVNLKVKNNGAYVDEYLQEGFISITLPTDREDAQSTWVWQGKEQDTTLVWIDPEEQVWNFRNNQDMGMVLAKGGNFLFDFGKLGWINCDVFMSFDGGLTTVTVKITGKAGRLAQYMGGEGDTYVFFVGKGLNVVAQLYTQVNASTVQSYVNSMPVGRSGKMFAFSVKEVECSYAAQDITISENQQITLDLQPIDREELNKRIKALDTFK